MIAETIVHLRSGVSALKFVGAAAEFQAAAEANPKSAPAAFVIRLRETGGGSPTYGRTRQKVAATVGVILVARNVADASGQAAGGDLDSLRAAVLGLLLGWSPTPSHDPLEFEGGALLAFRDGHLWWQDSYRTQYPITSA